MKTKKEEKTKSVSKTKVNKPKELTDKQKLFCLEYLKSFNATQAYKKVYGGTQKTCEVNGCKLLRNTKVSEYLAENAKKKVEKVGTSVEYVLENLQEIVEIGMGRKEVWGYDKKGNEVSKTILDLNNANSALEKIGKYHKMYVDKVEEDTSLNINIVSFKKNNN